MHQFMSPTQQEVWGIIEEINSAWLNGQPDRLLPIFHERMTIVGTGGRRYGEGKAACVDSYRTFVENAKIAFFETVDPQVDVYETTAIVSYSFAIEYVLNGEQKRDLGRDTFALERSNGKWLALWRQLIDQPVA
jgi:hypothetical protein